MKPNKTCTDPKSVGMNALRLIAKLTSELRQNLQTTRWIWQWLSIAHHLAGQSFMGLTLMADAIRQLQMQGGIGDIEDIEEILKRYKKVKGYRDLVVVLKQRQAFGKLSEIILRQERIEKKSLRRKYRKTMEDVNAFRISFAHPLPLKADIYDIRKLINTFLRSIELIEFFAFKRCPIEWDSEAERQEAIDLLNRARDDLLDIRRQIRAGALAEETSPDSSEPPQTPLNIIQNHARPALNVRRAQPMCRTGSAARRSRWGSEHEDIAGTIHPRPACTETLAQAAEVAAGVAVELYAPKRKSR